MRSKKVKNGILIGVILLLVLLLAWGIGLFVLKGKQSASPSTDAEPEIMTFIKDDDVTEDLEQEEFEDETTDKGVSTNATQKGGSETLGIVPSTGVEEDKDSEKTETNWLYGMW